MANKPTKDQLRAKKKQQAQRQARQRMHENNRMLNQVQDTILMAEQGGASHVKLQGIVAQKMGSHEPEDPVLRSALAQDVGLQCVQKVTMELTRQSGAGLKFMTRGCLYIVPPDEPVRAVWMPREVLLDLSWSLTDAMQITSKRFLDPGREQGGWCVYHLPDISDSGAINVVLVARMGSNEQPRVYLITDSGWVPIDSQKWWILNLAQLTLLRGNTPLTLEGIAAKFLAEVEILEPDMSESERTSLAAVKIDVLTYALSHDLQHMAEHAADQRAQHQRERQALQESHERQMAAKEEARQSLVQQLEQAQADLRRAKQEMALLQNAQAQPLHQPSAHSGQAAMAQRITALFECASEAV